MGLQKYRADIKGQTGKNGAVPYYTRWMGGPSLALVRSCPIRNTVIDTGVSPRTVYVRGEPDTFFSIPAACSYTITVRGPLGVPHRKRITLCGYLTTDDNGDYEFRCYKNQGV